MIMSFARKRCLTLQMRQDANLKKKELEDAIEKIIVAAKNGSMKIIIPLVYDNTIIALNDLGFQINVANHITSSTDSEFYDYYEVSWNNN